MLAEQQKRSNIGIGVGFLLEVGGRVLMGMGGSSGGPGGVVVTCPAEMVAGGVLALAGAVLFIWGCVEYCKGKGQSPWLGLLGFLSCIGLIILVFLPDNYKGGVPPSQTGGPGGGPGVWPPPPARP